MAKVKSLKMPDGFLNFPHLREKHAFGDEEARYKTEVIFPKNLEGEDKKRMDAILAEIEKQGLKAFEDDKERWEAAKASDGFRWPWRDSTVEINKAKMKGNPPSELYTEDSQFVRMKSFSDIPPQVVDASVCDFTGKIYSGILARVSISSVHVYTKGGLGVALRLGNVQILGKGKPFTASEAPPAVDAADEFDAVEVQDDDF